jgi:heterodisulfide reductase subunit A-like polyferredoxin/coenzyme F420-reducing hydrogenase delta subunit
VFVCECGEKIAEILDVGALSESALDDETVVYAGHTPYWCSADGRKLMQETVREQNLDRVVVAGCSPRTHRNIFKETIGSEGLNPELCGVVNIREGCAYPHRAEPEAANVRARDQIAMEVAHLTALTPRIPSQTEIAPAALVVGGGVAGMTAALELAYAGIPVTLVERTDALGGTASQENPELASDLEAAVRAHADIDLRLNSRLADVEGALGSYMVGVQNGTGEAPKSNTDGPYGAIIMATGAPDEETEQLAAMLRLPQDESGFLADLRVRLRPERYLERGFYVCGSAHQPCDAHMAQFQAFSAASRALRHLRRGSAVLRGPMAQVDADRCNGCSDCSRLCPFSAITMVERPEGVSLSTIDPLLCTGCGNCVSVCPVEAATLTGWSDSQLEAQMRVALDYHDPLPGSSAPQLGALGTASTNGDREPRILVFACEWSGYAATELAGAQKRALPANVRVIRLDCSGRLQAGLIFNAFEMGAAGVMVLGCAAKLCHYERGNERAAAAFGQVEELSTLLGLHPKRLKLAWTPPDDGAALADLINEFAAGVDEAVRAVV